jgi:hypothetical protein
MQANAYSKYALKDLHDAIDLIDRKIGYCQTYETFDSHEAQEAAMRKLSSKRASLVKSALALSALGVVSDSELRPRSFIHPVETAVAEPVIPEKKKSSAAARPRRTRS